MRHLSGLTGAVFLFPIPISAIVIAGPAEGWCRNIGRGAPSCLNDGPLDACCSKTDWVCAAGISNRSRVDRYRLTIYPAPRGVCTTRPVSEGPPRYNPGIAIATCQPVQIARGSHSLG